MQFRFQEFSRAVSAWAGAAFYPATGASLRRVKALVANTLKNGIVQSPFAIFNLKGKKSWHPKLKSLSLQVADLLKVSGFRRPNPTIAKALAARADMFASVAGAEAVNVEKSDLANSAQSWKEWVAEASNSSAAAAHRYTKAPLSLNNSDFNGNQKTRAQELDDEVSSWSLLWQEGAGSPMASFCSVPMLPPLAGSALVRASLSFKRGTCALGGIHPRHVALLSHGALDALAALLEAAEAVGVMPSQLLASFVALLPKQTGGLRPVVWAQSIFRVWSRARLDLVKRWEREHTHHLPFGAQANRAPTDIVWRHAFKVERAQVDGGHFACILWDLQKCYEMICHHKLAAAAVKHSYPLAVLRICLCNYRSPRCILYRGLVSRPIHAERGILAGISTATSELRLLLIDALTAHVSNHPTVSLNVFIDDVMLDSSSDSSVQVVEDLSCAAHDMLCIIERDVGLPVARSKSKLTLHCGCSPQMLGLLRRPCPGFGSFARH